MSAAVVAAAMVLAAGTAVALVPPPDAAVLLERGVLARNPAERRLLRIPVAAVGRAWRARSRVDRRRSRTVELCSALGAELRAGAMPADAIQRVVAGLPGICDGAGGAARVGGDVGAALLAAAARPGAEGLAQLAAVWSVAQHAGSGLADGCERVADWLREDEALRREVAAQLAGPRTSARMLAGLPVLGLALGSGIGARPLDVLLGTPYGLGCLGLGIVLAAAGVWWTERMARAVEDRL